MSWIRTQRLTIRLNIRVKFVLNCEKHLSFNFSINISYNKRVLYRATGLATSVGHKRLKVIVSPDGWLIIGPSPSSLSIRDLRAHWTMDSTISRQRGKLQKLRRGQKDGVPLIARTGLKPILHKVKTQRSVHALVSVNSPLFIYNFSFFIY